MSEVIRCKVCKHFLDVSARYNRRQPICSLGEGLTAKKLDDGPVCRKFEQAPFDTTQAPFTTGRKFDDGKLRYDLIPPEVLEALAEVLTYGAKKYEQNNWQKLEDFEARYTAADMRHAVASAKGEKIDPESGLSHLKHRLCNIAFLVWKEAQNE